MGFLREIVGLTLIAVAWFNFFNLNLPMRIMIFILGFDMVSLVLKIGVFALGYFLLPSLLTLGRVLLILAVTEVISTFFLIGLIGKIIKPVAVFIIGYFVLGFQLALILAAIDFFLNIRLGK
jgi:hypothetical protein